MRSAKRLEKTNTKKEKRFLTNSTEGFDHIFSIKKNFFLFFFLQVSVLFEHRVMVQFYKREEFSEIGIIKFNGLGKKMKNEKVFKKNKKLSLSIFCNKSFEHFQNIFFCERRAK